MIRSLLFVVLLLGSLSSTGYAQSREYDEKAEAETAVKVRKRIYPGGRDEEDLKVQNQVATPPRKLAPQAEIKDESEE